jgi:hypothetical protein
VRAREAGHDEVAEAPFVPLPECPHERVVVVIVGDRSRYVFRMSRQEHGIADRDPQR